MDTSLSTDRSLKRVIIAASKNISHFEEELEIIRKSLASRRVSLAVAPWDDPDVCWQNYDLVILSRVWSYTQKPEQFLHWLRQLEEDHVKAENCPQLIRWNMDKSYLLDLSKRGIPVIDSVMMDSDKLTLDGASVVAQGKGWKDIVIKPSVGSGSRHCYRLTQNPDSGIYLCDDDIDFKAYSAICDKVLIQPFISTIKSIGEWSVVIIDGRCSHTVVLRPAVNEFRLKGLPRQSPETKPPTEIIPLAEEVISKLPAPTLYARVDMMLNPCTNKYEVSELEIIEPGLYLTTSDRGLALFINGILRRIGSQPELA